MPYKALSKNKSVPFSDEVRQVYCEADRICSEELEDTFVATLRLRQSKARCLLEAARYTESRSGRIEIVGEQGQLVGDHVHGYGMIIRGRQPEPIDVSPPVNTVEAVLNAFIKAILSEAEPPISAVDGLQTLEIAEACYYSASSGTSVELYGDDEDEDAYVDDLDEDLWRG